MRAIFWIAILSLYSAVGACQADNPDTLVAFTTDGCSSFPDGTLSHQQLWHRCCTAHDLAYWAGGVLDERLKADLELRACVISVGEPAVAELMLAGVRVGGSPWLPTTFRWGYGWPYTHGYTALTPEENTQVSEQKKRQGIN